MLVNNHSEISKKEKLIKITLHLDEVVADYLKSIQKKIG